MNNRIFTFAGYNCLITAPNNWLNVLDKYYSTFISQHKGQIWKYELQITEIESKNKFISNKLELNHNFSNQKLELNTSFDPFTAFPMLDRAIKKMFTYVFWKNNGFVIHASALAYKNKAYVFTGKSGAGKSTLVNNVSNSVGIDILSDNEIFIKYTKKNTLCYANPFIELSNYRRNPKNTESVYPLESLFQIIQSKKNKINTLSFTSLLTNKDLDIFAPSWENEQDVKQQIFQKLMDIYKKNLLKELHFTKDLNFINLLKES